MRPCIRQSLRRTAARAPGNVEHLRLTLRWLARRDASPQTCGTAPTFVLRMFGTLSEIVEIARMAGNRVDVTYRFDGFVFAQARGTLRGPDGADLALRPKALALLVHLLGNPGRLLRRDDLLDQLWPGVTVTDDSLTQCVSELRQAFGERAPLILRTVPRQGYVMAATVESQAAAPEQIRSSSSSLAETVARRSAFLMVHPFESRSDDPACAAFAHALTNDLVTRLSCIEDLRIATSLDSQIPNGFRIRGEVRAGSTHLHMAVRLEDAVSGTLIWAERLDRSRSDLAEPTDDMVKALAFTLDRQISTESMRRARGKPEPELTARELSLLGREHHYRGTEADTLVAYNLFDRAMSLDPDYATPFAWQAYTLQRVLAYGWSFSDGEAARERMLQLSRRAVQIDPESPLCLVRLALSLALHQRWDEAVVTAQAAIKGRRTAGYETISTFGNVMAAAGYPEEAAKEVSRILALDPLCSPDMHAVLGRALLLAGQPEEALQALRWCAARRPEHIYCFHSMVVAAVETGRMDEARAALEQSRRLQPAWVPQNNTGAWFFRRAVDLGRFLDAFRMAGCAAACSEDDPTAGPPGDIRPITTASPQRSQPQQPLAATAECQAAATPAASRQADLVLRRRALVALLPFDCPGPDPACQRLAANLASDLLGELAEFEELRLVPAAHPTAYRVRGEVRSSGGALRILVRLEAADGTTLWSDRLDAPRGGDAEPDDAAVGRLAVNLARRVNREDLLRARDADPASLSARQLRLLGADYHQRATEADTLLALDVLERAVALDPGFAMPYAWLSYTVQRAFTHGWGPLDPAVARARTLALAQRAVQLEPGSALCLGRLAYALVLQGRCQDAAAAAHRAVADRRNAPWEVWTTAADVLVYVGEPEEAVVLVRRAVVQDPLCPPMTRGVLGRALLLAGHPDKAIPELQWCGTQLPHYYPAFDALVVAATEAGRPELARDAMADLRRLQPFNPPEVRWLLCRPADIERYRRAFAAA